MKEKIKETLKKFVPFIVIYAVLFYIGPLFVITKADYERPLMMLIFLIFPTVCLSLPTVFAMNNKLAGYNWFFVLIEPLLFLPTIFIYYGTDMMLYLGLYFVLTLAGLLLGFILRRIFKTQ